MNDTFIYSALSSVGCGFKYPAFRKNKLTGEFETVERTYHCKNKRICRHCYHHFHKRNRSIIEQILDLRDDRDEQHEYWQITLSPKAVPVENLREAIANTREIFHRVKRKLKDYILGIVYRVELNHVDKKGKCHAHIHALVDLVTGSKQRMKDEFELITWLTSKGYASPDVELGFEPLRELDAWTKYMTKTNKAADLLKGVGRYSSLARTLDRELKGVRLYGFTGSFAVDKKTVKAERKRKWREEQAKYGTTIWITDPYSDNGF